MEKKIYPSLETIELTEKADSLSAQMIAEQMEKLKKLSPEEMTKKILEIQDYCYNQVFQKEGYYGI